MHSDPVAPYARAIFIFNRVKLELRSDELFRPPQEPSRRAWTGTGILAFPISHAAWPEHVRFVLCKHQIWGIESGSASL